MTRAKGQATRLTLSLGMGLNPRVERLMDGRVKPEGVDIVASNIHGSELFWRQLRFQDFDISEMSISSLLIAVAAGNRDWLAIPVFTTRRFFHSTIWVRADAGIRRPEDLRGRRVGVPEYQQTAALWARGALQHEFGVSPTEMHWHMERGDGRSHGAATGFQSPAGVTIEPIAEDKSIGSMLLSGELDATILYLQENNLVDRSRIRLQDHPEVRYLFDDPAAEGRRYYAKTGLFPINHVLVMRRTIAEQHPWAVLNLYNAFTRAKLGGLDELSALAQPHLQLGLLPEGSGKALRQDPFPYGVAANRSVLERLTLYSYEQGLTPRQIPLDEIFAPCTLEL